MSRNAPAVLLSWSQYIPDFWQNLEFIFNITGRCKIQDKSNGYCYIADMQILSHIKTYSDQARAYIKKRLLDGTLKPGDPIRESEIAAHLGISRGPVREALQSLHNQGLVTGEPQKARFIRQMSAREIEDSYCLGGTLEGACIVQSLEKFDATAFEALDEILEEMKRQSMQAKGLAAMSQVDEAFHDELISRCHNRLMAGIARNSCSHISKFLYYREWDTLFSPGEFYQRHKVITEAVYARDPLFIEKTLLEHYAESGRRLGLVCAGSMREGG